MKTYFGKRDAEGIPKIIVRDAAGEERELQPRFDLLPANMLGFEWGYAGAGPMQTACALLADVTGKPDVALLFFQGFAHMTVQRLPIGREWELSEGDIRRDLFALSGRAHMESKTIEANGSSKTLP